MARILIFLIVLGVVIGVMTAALRVRSAARINIEDRQLPKSVQILSYVLLITLMMGVVTGWLGGL